MKATRPNPAAVSAVWAGGGIPQNFAYKHKKCGDEQPDGNSFEDEFWF